jgi:hypothetical protein
MAELSTTSHMAVTADAPPQSSGLFQLDELVRKLLLEHGFSQLPEEEQQRLLPSFTEQALIRLGAAIAPRLNEEGIEEFVSLSEDVDATPETWAVFWKQNVPDFAFVVQTALEQYAQEIEVHLSA